MFIMVDGIDGSGKRTIVEAMRDELLSTGMKSFDIGEWSKANHELPSPKAMAETNLVIGVEPTYTWVGAAIREEMVRDGCNYATRDIAAAFSLDRLMLYRRCYLPALQRGATIIAERGVSSSLVYQPAADPSITLEEELALSGNALAMEHAPNHLVIAALDPKIAMERLARRFNKQDQHLYEKETFLRLLDERYRSDWLRSLFTSFGTQVHFLDTNKTIDDVQSDAKKLCSSLLEKSSTARGTTTPSISLSS